jgi:hypothetical protein
MTKEKQVAVDLAGYPELVVIYLGMRVNTLRGLKTLRAFGPRIKASVRAQPDGLLLHEDIVWGMFPPHFGMRQYWRDFDSLERWARTDPHAQWWRGFVRDRGAPDSGTRPTSLEAVSSGLSGHAQGHRVVPVRAARCQAGLDVLGSATVGCVRPGNQGKPAPGAGVRHLHHRSG